VVAILTLGVASPASAATTTFAYLDPATGTLIISAIIGGFAAIAMFFRRYFYRAKDLVMGTKSETDVADATMDPAQHPIEDPSTPD
jgi:hypothetical protein